LKQSSSDHTDRNQIDNLHDISLGGSCEGKARCERTPEYGIPICVL